MIVGGEELFRRSVLIGAKECNFKNTSYYLTIGEIVPLGDAQTANFRYGDGPYSYSLGPREMVWVTSAEQFNFQNDDMFGLATLRTTLTKSGLLALNTGIVDPNYKGPIGTALINFSSVFVPLQKGDQFMRIIFVSHKKIDEKYLSPVQTFKPREYLRELQSESIAKFPKNFLNSQDLSDDFCREFERKFITYIFRKYFLIIIPIILFLIYTGGNAAFTYLGNILWTAPPG